MRRILFYLFSLLFALVIIGIAYVYMNPEKIVDRVINRQIADRMAFDVAATEGEIIVYTVGTSTPLPGERAQTSTAVFVNGRFFLFDVGYGSVGKMEQFNLPLDKLDAVFLTHWHSDHFIDLPYVINRSWQLGRKQQLDLYTPIGGDSILHNIHQMLGIENQHRVDHHGLDIMPIAYAGANCTEIPMEKNGSQLVYDQDGIQITAFDVCHEPVSPDFGYRITYNNKVLVLSGDTKKCDNVIKYAEGADLLIHEAMLKDVMHKVGMSQKQFGNLRNAKILSDILDYHASPAEAAEVAEAAGVKKLVLHHLGPTPDNLVIKRLYNKDLGSIFDGPVVLASDGDKFVIN